MFIVRSLLILSYVYVARYTLCVLLLGHCTGRFEHAEACAHGFAGLLVFGTMETFESYTNHYPIIA